MIGRHVFNMASECSTCDVRMADVDVIYDDEGHGYCSTECAPAQDRAESLDGAGS